MDPRAEPTVTRLVAFVAAARASTGAVLEAAYWPRQRKNDGGRSVVADITSRAIVRGQPKLGCS